jgi:hypothetical protein
LKPLWGTEKAKSGGGQLHLGADEKLRSASPSQTSITAREYHFSCLFYPTEVNVSRGSLHKEAARNYLFAECADGKTSPILSPFLQN